MQTYRRKKIHNICKEIWDNHKLKPGFNLEKLLNKINVNYAEESLSDNISAILVIKDDKKLITVNKGHHINRQRFSIAHEIGHLLLGHKKEIDVKTREAIYFRNEVSSLGIDNDEIEANYFAANLLMPEEQIFNHLDKDKSFEENVSIIAKSFTVSEAATTRRFINLGLA